MSRGSVRATLGSGAEKKRHTDMCVKKTTRKATQLRHLETGTAQQGWQSKEAEGLILGETVQVLLRIPQIVLSWCESGCTARDGK